MTPQAPIFTGHKTKDEILFMLVCCARVDRAALMAFNKSYPYISKALWELSRDGLIKTSKNRPTTISLSASGVELLKLKSPDSYEHYMRISNGHRPGGTKRHIEIARRTANTLSHIFMAGARIGPLKPTLQDIVSGTHPKLDPSIPTFYLNREMRYSDEQKEARIQTSRASGVLFSEGVRALVYNSMNAPIRLPRRAEKEANIRLVRQATDLYANTPPGQTQDSIVFCSDDDSAINIFNTRATEKGGNKFIGDAIWDKTLTGTGFRYLPMNADGITSLKHILNFTREDFLRICFSDEEREAAKKAREGEGLIKGLICYEYLSCNVTKLAYIKRAHKDLSKVGIICWEGQENFVTRFLEEPSLHARVIRRENINQILNIEE